MHVHIAYALCGCTMNRQDASCIADISGSIRLVLERPFAAVLGKIIEQPVTL